jgi:hypothetical protein
VRLVLAFVCVCNVFASGSGLLVWYHSDVSLLLYAVYGERMPTAARLVARQKTTTRRILKELRCLYEDLYDESHIRSQGVVPKPCLVGDDGLSKNKRVQHMSSPIPPNRTLDAHFTGILHIHTRTLRQNTCRQPARHMSTICDEGWRNTSSWRRQGQYGGTRNVGAGHSHIGRQTILRIEYVSIRDMVRRCG